MMADRTYPAQALHEEGHLPIGASLDEFLKAAEFDDMQARFMDAILCIEHQRNLAVSLDARDGIDGNAPDAGRRIFNGCGGRVLFHDAIALIVMEKSFGKRRFAAFQQIAKHAQKFIGGRRASWQVIIHMNHLM